MTTNYNGSAVGVPYVRAPKITINYSTTGEVQAVIEQALAVKLADGSIRHLESMPPIVSNLNLAADGAAPIALVSPEDGSGLGADTSLNEVFLGVLAVVRQIQLAQPE